MSNAGSHVPGPAVLTPLQGWLAEHVVGAQKRLFPSEGHLSLGVGKVNEIVADLVALGSARVTPK